jgi:hypothetical protein
MKTLFMLTLLVGTLVSGFAGTTIDSVNRNAYGANVGWVNWAGDTANGAVIGSYVCSGYLYGANVGWINLGSGTPTNGINYQNLAGNDFGVNCDGLGNLRGYAWGANIGWLNCETNGAPHINLATGQFAGSVWSANCGWISLSNAVAYVKTDSISPGTLDTNGLPVAWELTYFGHTGLNPNADPANDGMTLYEDYLAGVNPTNASGVFAITGQTVSAGTNVSLTWNSVPTRYYYIFKATNLGSPSWADSGLGLISPAGASTTRSFNASNAPARFFRVQAVRPLTP